MLCTRWNALIKSSELYLLECCDKMQCNMLCTVLWYNVMKCTSSIYGTWDLKQGTDQTARQTNLAHASLSLLSVKIFTSWGFIISFSLRKELPLGRSHGGWFGASCAGRRCEKGGSWVGSRARVLANLTHWHCILALVFSWGLPFWACGGCGRERVL